MLTPWDCAFQTTTPLFVQAELADRSNPPTRPLPADPVVRHPKVTVSGKQKALPLLPRAMVAIARWLPLCLRACNPVAPLVVTGLFGDEGAH